MTHPFQTGGAPEDYFGRAYCARCHLPGEPGDQRHPAQEPRSFQTFAEASEPPEREEATQ